MKALLTFNLNYIWRVTGTSKKKIRHRVVRKTRPISRSVRVFTELKRKDKMGRNYAKYGTWAMVSSR